MTRFARAKGSKSSNERLPDEPTPWHVMKQQLEDALSREKEKESQTKTKSAKQLLKEKDDPYYSKSIGQVNTDWAEFENSKDKESVKSGKVKKKEKGQDKKLKKAFEKTDVDVSKNVDSADNKEVKIKKKKNKQENEVPVHTEENNLTITHKKKQKQKPEDINDSSSNLKQKKQDTVCNGTEDDKSNQFKDKKRKSIENENNKQSKKLKKKEKAANESESTKEDNVETNKLSKRQKRNQKKQNQKVENAKSDAFNVKGDDWNCSLNFGKKKKFAENNNENADDSKKGFNNRDNLANKPKGWLSDFDFKNWKRFGDNVPKKYQKKTAKIRDNDQHRPRKSEDPSMKVTINGMDVEIVKYDGFPVRKEDAERLKELRKEMILKGIPKKEIDAAMKLERRKCEKALARIRKQVCFHCRKAGHNLSDCPDLEKEEVGTGICFKCGSTEHTHFECKVSKSDDYRYAKCFICREQGHIAKQCRDNPKGLYPDGGCCKICGDVTHLKKDCPDLVKEKEETTITLDTINDDNLEQLDTEVKASKPENKPTKKIVKF